MLAIAIGLFILAGALKLAADWSAGMLPAGGRQV